MATDWTALKLEYVHGTCTMRELADKHGIKPAGLMKRAATEKWEAERKQKSAKVSKTASEAILLTRADELSKFNEDDLAVAKKIRTLVKQQIDLSGGEMEPMRIRALASAAAEAQKIGRLALGASTENSAVNTNDAAKHDFSDFTDAELEALAVLKSKTVQ